MITLDDIGHMISEAFADAGIDEADHQQWIEHVLAFAERIPQPARRRDFAEREIEMKIREVLGE